MTARPWANCLNVEMLTVDLPVVAITKPKCRRSWLLTIIFRGRSLTPFSSHSSLPISVMIEPVLQSLRRHFRCERRFVPPRAAVIAINVRRRLRLIKTVRRDSLKNEVSPANSPLIVASKHIRFQTRRLETAQAISLLNNATAIPSSNIAADPSGQSHERCDDGSSLFGHRSRLFM